jgi:hypothetical protein
LTAPSRTSFGLKPRRDRRGPVVNAAAASSRGLWLLALALCSAACCSQSRQAASASETGTLEIVLDASALGQGGAAPPPGVHPQPVSAASWKLELTSATGAAPGILTTDDHGLARVALPPGEYLVTVPGNPVRPSQSVRVTVTAGRTSQEMIHLINALP